LTLQGSLAQAAAYEVCKQKIINKKATLNFGLSKELQLMFPETVPVPRPLRETCVIPHSQ